MAAGYPGFSSSFIPSHESTGYLITNFSRKIGDYALNKYVTYTNVDKPTGYFLKMTYEQAARLPSTDGSEFVWGDGEDAPSGVWQKDLIEWDTYTTKRFAFPFQLPQQFVNNASWDVVAQYSALVAQQAMTLRTLLTYTTLDTSGNWLGADTATGQWYTYAGTTGGASTGALYHLGISGGTASSTSGLAGLASGTSNNPLIKKFLMAAMARMNLGTLGVIKDKDFVLVMSPTVARNLAVSEEIQDFIKQSPGSQLQIKADTMGNGGFGLPASLYGIPTVIDDTVRISAKKKGTGQSSPAASPAYIWGNSIALIARPGSLNGGPIGSPSFSGLHLFFNEEMTVETMNDVDNRRINGRVVENYAVKPVAPVGVFFIDNCLG